MSHLQWNKKIQQYCEVCNYSRIKLLIFKYAKSFLEEAPKDSISRISSSIPSAIIRYPYVSKVSSIELDRWKWGVFKTLGKNDPLKGFSWALLLSSTTSVLQNIIYSEFPELGL